MSVLQIKRAEELPKEHLLGPWATGFSLFKGFVGTGILYMPLNFIQAGWAFSTATLVAATMLNILAAKFLIETRVKLGGNLSYSDIGEKLFGRAGKIVCEAAIIGSQFTLVTAYVYYIAGTMQTVYYDYEIYMGAAVSTPYVNKWIFGLIIFCVYVPLCWIRNMTKLASTHLFGDIMIIMTVLFIMGCAIGTVVDNGHFKTSGEPAINTKLFPDAFGFSIFAFCGMGTVLPTYDVAANKDSFFKILVYVCLTIMAIYIIFPLVCISAYGSYSLRN